MNEFIIVIRPKNDKGDLVRLLATQCKHMNYNIDSIRLKNNMIFDISVEDMELYNSIWL
ncbi:hypothetical protein IID62_04530, partial [candidate division KSB1 bacterium]|nr:hypothetical protein [candidate division KSB1 bacterium]